MSEADRDFDLRAIANVFQLYGQFLAFHLYHRLLRDPDAKKRARVGFEQLLSDST